MAYSSVQGRYFAGKQVKCEFVSLTRWKVAICGEYMKSRLKTCSRGSACNFLHCFSNPGGDYEWADCDKPPPRYWVKKMTALFGYSDVIDQPSPKDQQHSSRISASDKDSHHYKRHRSIDANQHNGSSSRSYHEETPTRKSRHCEREEYDDVIEDGTEYKNSYHYRRHRSIDPSQHNGISGRSHREECHARKSRHRERQEDDNMYDEMEYKNNYLETDSDGDRLNRTRHRDRSELHIRRENKPRHTHKKTPDSRGSSSDEDSDTHAYTKRRSRHRKNISEPSSNDAKTEPSENNPTRHKRHKTKSTRRRSQHSDRDEVDRVEERSRHRPSRSRSHESADRNDTSDRWQPDSEHGDYSSKLDAKDYETSDDRKPKDGAMDRTRSGSVVEDTSKEVRRSRERDDRTREKRKRI